jgi:acyl-coenzyme A synthetase/AMP-(fatty) acid ligase
VTDTFRTKEGRVISPVFFAHLMGVIFKDVNIGKFQFIQKSLDRIVIKIEKTVDLHDSFTQDLKSKVRLAMGDNCIIEVEHVNKIPKTPSGKFRYAVNEAIADTVS